MSRRTIRHARPDDAPAIRSVARESWHAAYDSLLGADVVDETVDEWYDLESLRDDIADAAGRDDAVVFVAEPETQDPRRATGSTDLTGFAHVGPWRADSSVAFLLRVYVRPEAWGAGTGTGMLERARKDLRDEFDRCRLVVLADNEVGVTFYESRGFDRVETRESDLGDGLEEYVYERPW